MTKRKRIDANVGLNLKEYEQQLTDQGYKKIIGVDEVGRGALVGDVVVCACHVPIDVVIPGINDSKKLSAKKRNQIYQLLINHPDVEYIITRKSSQEIDQLNILQATMEAMTEAVNKLSTDCVLIDGNTLPKNLPEGLHVETVIQGDAKCYSIAAASIIAKVVRDNEMIELDKLYPMYGFKTHKGYGTKQHCEALLKHGPMNMHRMTFKPVKEADLKFKQSTTLLTPVNSPHE